MCCYYRVSSALPPPPHTTEAIVLNAVELSIVVANCSLGLTIAITKNMLKQSDMGISLVKQTFSQLVLSTSLCSLKKTLFSLLLVLFAVLGGQFRIKRLFFFVRILVASGTEIKWARGKETESHPLSPHLQALPSPVYSATIGGKTGRAWRAAQGFH